MNNKVNVGAGALGGIIGGVPFGMLMGMMGMLPMVAMLVKSESAVVGFVLHMVISTLTGIAFAYIFGAKISSIGSGTKSGLIYGVIWWFLGPLIVMPMMLGMGMMLSVEGMLNAMPSLMGHLIFGGILGAYYGYAVGKK